MLRNLSLLILAAVLAVGAGVWYSSQKFESQLIGNRQNLSFWLLDQAGELVKFPTDSSQRTLIFYMPDDISTETQENFMQIVQKREVVSKENLRVLPISRNLRDNLLNLKSKSGFWDSIIHDPSGVVLKFFRQFRSEWENDLWVSAMFDGHGKLLWSQIAKRPIFPNEK